MSIDFPYQLTRRARRTVSIRIHPDKGVQVSAPTWVSQSDILNFLEAKSQWIRKHLQLVNARPKVAMQFTSGEKHLYFGESFPLCITRSPLIKRARVSLLYDVFEALIPQNLTPLKEFHEIKYAFTKWYLKQGKKIITQKVDHFCKILKVDYNRITLKRVSSIWGSCSRRNNLNFNRKLIMAPHPVVDYVVIHEVCHLLHRHHQQSFWSEVKKLDPNYKQHIRWLKSNQHLLSL